MNNENNPIKTLNEIKGYMESSVRFISLSGLSGVFAGIFALLGAASAYVYLNTSFLDTEYYRDYSSNISSNLSFTTFFIIDALIVLMLALTFGIWLTSRKARKLNLPLWSKTSKLLIINLFIPLFIGGVFCLILLYHHLIALIAPSMLIFYGLALFNAGKFAQKEIRILGLIECLLGLLGCFFLGYGLILWAFGFGILHIIYGSIMYYKYDKC